MEAWKGKRVLVTGVCGTVGGEILRQLVTLEPLEIIGIDNNESELFFLEQAFRDGEKPVTLALGDVRDVHRLRRAMEGVDVVLHAAAFKHVELCERSPRDAIQTNVLGVQNIIDASIAQNVERVVFTSSDKAVNPTSVMGTSKLMGERLFTAADSHRRGDRPVYASTRFGNVLGSRGSVIPLFRRQIQQGGPVTLTDPKMTRFIMTLKEAVGLTMGAVFMANGGEVFVTKMPVVRIVDLAHVMAEELAPRYGYDPSDIEIKTVGPKAGEKMYEELINEEEVRRAEELPQYFVIQAAVLPLHRKRSREYPVPVLGSVQHAYNSANETPMGREELRSYLLTHGLLTADDVEEAPTPQDEEMV